MTPRQKRFFAEFLVDLEVAEAAVRAGYSARTAKRQGRRLLKALFSQAADGPTERPKAGAAAKVPLAEIVAGLLKEATREGDGSSHSARVAAWGHLVRIAGIADNVRHSGEIQYVPPYTPKRGR